MKRLNNIRDFKSQKWSSIVVMSGVKLMVTEQYPLKLATNQTGRAPTAWGFRAACGRATTPCCPLGPLRPPVPGSWLSTGAAMWAPHGTPTEYQWTQIANRLQQMMLLNVTLSFARKLRFISSNFRCTGDTMFDETRVFCTTEHELWIWSNLRTAREVRSSFDACKHATQWGCAGRTY